jgi:hypothetical protein
MKYDITKINGNKFEFKSMEYRKITPRKTFAVEVAAITKHIYQVVIASEVSSF